MAHRSIFQAVQNIGINVKLWQYNRAFQQNERFVGIRPEIVEYGPFLRGYESSNMSDKWQKGGIPIKGNNYWTFGPATNLGSSLRFDPTNALYQAWFGIYTHIGIDGMRFGIKDNEPEIVLLKLLAEVDQEFWLKAYGDINPIAKLTKFEKREKIKIDGNDAWLYYGEINSHSDVGLSGKGYEGVYGLVRSKKLISNETTDASLFAPNPLLWEAHVTPYHEINLKGFFAVVPFERATACIYINGAEYQDNNRRHYDTWPKLEREAMDMIQSIRISHLARK